MHVYSIKKYQSVLTNGEDKIEIVCNRWGCGITPPRGMTFSILNNEYYINGKKAWLEIVEEG